MSELENLRKQLKEKNWFDFWLVACFKENAKTLEEQENIAKEILLWPNSKYWPPGSIMGFMVWNMESYEAKSTPWLRCHLDENDCSLEDYKKLNEDLKKNTFTLPEYKGKNNT